MTDRGTRRKDRAPSERRVQEALAALIRNTRTTSRSLSLVEIEEWLRVAVQELGSVGAVADRIGLSTKMLRQFQAVAKLSRPVRQLFASREIDSVDAAVHLSMIEPGGQLSVARELASARIDTSDVRAIHDLAKRQPMMPLTAVVRNIKETRNIREYVVEFVVRVSPQELQSVRGRFAAILGEDNIVSLNIEDSIGALVLNKTGRQNLMKLCRSSGMSKRRAITHIAEGETV